MYDAIVVGARCAGAPTAMLLARQGYKVLLVDAARFPSDIPHGHFIHRHGPQRLKHWGLLDRIVASGCPPTTSILMDVGDFPLHGRDLEVDGVALGYGPRRTVLDALLIDAAVEAGVEFRPGFIVEGFLTDKDAIVGIRGRERVGGATILERARFTIGADGRNSGLARFVKAPRYDATATTTLWSFSYWSGVPDTQLEIYMRPRSAIFMFPTHADLLAVFIGAPIGELERVRADVNAFSMTILNAEPALSDRLRTGRREERWYGAADLPHFYRKPYGAGWALIGDAGCHKDPFLALGICDAFRDVELLVAALDAGFDGRQSFAAALADFERIRYELSHDEYRENLRLARFDPPPSQLLAMRAAVRGDQDATNRFFLAREGLIPRAEATASPPSPPAAAQRSHPIG